MSHQTNSQINVIRELRLRRWARNHYVPAEERLSTWNPVVLEEMMVRDREIQSQLENAPPLVSQFVPLSPEPVNILHPAHENQNEPKLLHTIQEVKKHLKQEKTGFQTN